MTQIHYFYILHSIIEYIFAIIGTEPHMDTHSLEAFLAVTDQGSFSLAAEMLFITQPAVSKRIAALEQELHVRLFDRLGKRVLLTEAGRALLPKARHIMQELADSRRLLANLSSEISGLLPLATSHHIGLHHLPQILRDFTLRYPQVELKICFTSSDAAYAMVDAGELELAIVTLSDQYSSTLLQEKLWHDPLSIMVAKHHPLAHPPIDADTLSQYPAILPEPGTFTRTLIETPLTASGVNIKIGLETNYLETIRMLVAVGLGWSVLPLTMLTDDMVPLTLPGVHLQRELGVITHSARTLSKAAQQFIELQRNDQYK